MGKIRYAWVAAAALSIFAGPAMAVTIDCETANNANFVAGLANSDGYTVGANISASGVLTINNTVLTLPPNGIICVKSVSCQTTSRSLTFAKNANNTAVTLLVEDDFTLQSNGCGIDVSGSNASNTAAVGADRLGGLGGPGGSDGGSCDFTDALDRRAGEGIGPGGGKASNTVAGGGGASPVTGGGVGFSGGAVGGGAYAVFTDTITHGGSGGGCGTQGSTGYGGGGGGGMILVAAGGTINISGSSAYVRARGGATNVAGGGGGGGVIRLVADVIQGSGLLQVEGSSAATNCGTSSIRGGCGGAGLIKLEGAASGTILTKATPLTALKIGTPQPLVLSELTVPTLEVTSIDSTYAGAPNTQSPGPLLTTEHVHRSPSVFIEAPNAPEQTITVTLESTNVPATATVRVRMNALGTASAVVAASTSGTGSGTLTWTAALTVPGGMELATVEAWIEDVCTPGSPGCGN